ncbi:hypothetical protein HYFRA_00004168 [Hymenoscyphus fraxineus]|uniref:Heterokaryon incompatibility domain-containing protein n=1 Tax=Hymenoscyphus fraxineus TaxID=746836 RepID=A0A9N9KMM0_9HELO|nr:hypothetical protein HYFRA_00004168 [Hymenoscyphus fraxineus]
MTEAKGIEEIWIILALMRVYASGIVPLLLYSAVLYKLIQRYNTKVDCLHLTPLPFIQNTQTQTRNARRAALEIQAMDNINDGNKTENKLETFSHALCKRCSWIQQHQQEQCQLPEDERPNDIEYRSRISSLDVGNCGICQVFMRAAEGIKGGSVQGLRLFIMLHAKEVLLHVRGGSSIGHTEEEKEFYISSRGNQPSPWPLFTQISDDSLSIRDYKLNGLSSVEIAAQWTKECLSTHLNCQIKVETNLPNRVLFIGKESADVRLFQTNNIMGSYACLSHCWGQKDLLRTTVNNLDVHKEAIPWDHLPKTFQDAISVARQLSIDYLWIDSLCIVQDDEDDWIRESQTMCEVYQNSLLTIAATSAPDASTGLFLKHGKPRRRFNIPGKTSAGMEFSLEAHERRGSCVHPDFRETTAQWPLLRRAWVFQERLLSPRFIQFGSEELIWECQEKFECECGQDLRGSAGIWEKKQFHEAMNEHNNTGLVTQWQYMVAGYSSLELSYASDKLPALSGLAKQMHSKRPDENYCAGLWSGSLCTDLLWLIQNGRHDFGHNINDYSHQVPAYRAPSWSWASTDERIFYPPVHLNIHVTHTFFTIDNVYIRLATQDATGKVKNGSLTITGPVFKVHMIDLNPTSGKAFLIEDSENRTLELTRYESYDDKLYFDSPRYPIRTCGDTSGFSGSIKCIRMSRVKSDENEFGGREYAMMVQKSTTSTSYQRIGMIELFRFNPGKDAQKGDLDLQWLKFPSFFEEGGTMETITIVCTIRVMN